MSCKYIVVLEVDKNGNATVFLANHAGDPGRTTLKAFAKIYPSISSATFGLAHARKHREFRDAYILELKE